MKKLKTINVHPDYHRKLLRLANGHYRSLVKQIEYMIDKDYNKAYSFEDENILRLKEE